MNCAGQDQTTPGVSRRRRSVSYPRVPLAKIIEKLALFRDGRARGLPADQCLGMKPGGWVWSALGAMKAYGLVEGHGEALDLTSLGRRALSDEPIERREAASRAAFEPYLFARFFDEPDMSKWSSVAIDHGCRPDVINTLVRTFLASAHAADLAPEPFGWRPGAERISAGPRVGRLSDGATLFGRPAVEMTWFLQAFRHRPLRPASFMARSLDRAADHRLLEILVAASVMSPSDGDSVLHLTRRGRSLCRAEAGADLAHAPVDLSGWFSGGWRLSPFRRADHAGVGSLDPMDVIAWDDETSRTPYPAVRIVAAGRSSNVFSAVSDGCSIDIERSLTLREGGSGKTATCRLAIAAVKAPRDTRDRLRGLVSCCWQIMEIVERDAGMLCVLLRDRGARCRVDIELLANPGSSPELLAEASRLLGMGLLPLADMGFQCDDELNRLLTPVRLHGVPPESDTRRLS